MSNNKLVILGVIAVVMAGLAVLQSRMNRPAAATNFSSSPLIEGLALDSITSITVTSEKGSKKVTLDRVDGTFTVKDKSGYPADISRINSLITKCLDIRTRDKITSNPANHADLKVTPETARYVVAFLDKEGKAIVDMAVSESDPEKGTAYARLLSGNDVFLIDNDPWISTGAMDYMNTKLLEITEDKVVQVGVHAPQESYSLKRAENGGVLLAEVPAGKKQDDSACKTVFGALSSLLFEDVLKEAPEGVSFDYTYSCKLSDTTIYKLTMAKKDDKIYAKVSADFMDKTPVEKERRVESEEELKQKEAKLLAIDAVNTFNQRHTNWVYQLPSYKAADLTKAMSELLEKPAENKENDAAAAAENSVPAASMEAIPAAEPVSTPAAPAETPAQEL